MDHSKSKTIESTLALIILLAMVLVFSRQTNMGLNNLPDQVSEVSDGWYYIENEKKIPVVLPASIIRTSGGDLTLYCDGLTEESAGQVLTTRGAVYRLQVSSGERVLYQYDDSSFPRNAQMASKVNCAALLPDDYNGETISFTYENTSDGIYKIPKIYAGTPSAVFLYHCSRDTFTLLSILVLTILGILTICISLYLKRMQVREKRFADIACFLLFCVCWFLTDSSLAQMISGSSPILRYISFYAFMMLGVPMLHFIKNTKSMNNCLIIDIIIYIFYGNAILQSLLNYFGLFDFVDMLFVTHILLFGGSTVLMTLLIRAHQKTNDQELLVILHSFAVVAGGGVLSLILYWLLDISCYEIFFECGIIIFIIMLIRILIITMVQNLNFRTEMAVYQRLAKEDHLTGMKNRRAFDEEIMKIEEHAVSYQSLFLVFMDLNRLKKTNDTLGHQVGNELIIAAARCIEKAFGELGTCYRIGGDEFCALLPDSKLSEEELSARLDEEIQLYNKVCSRYQVSIARGFSDLKGPDGNPKPISDWKKEADLKMYMDKGWIKCEE